MGLTGIAIELSTTCPRCQAPLPLNGASESVLCDKCQTPYPTPPALWETMLGDVIGPALELNENEGKTSTIIMGNQHVKLMYGLQPPRCTCKAPFDPEVIPRGVTAGKLHCTTCGKPAIARAAPDWIRSLHPSITSLVGETQAVPTAKGVSPAELKFHCYHCGAPLPIDGSSRSVSCGHCKASVMVPDEIWVRLHPAKTVDRWFIVLAMDAKRGVGRLPADSWNSDDWDFEVEPGGNVIISFQGDDKDEVGHRGRIALVDREGVYLWLQKGIEFDEKAKLVTSLADGTAWLVDPSSQRPFIRAIDPRTGDPIRTLAEPEHQGPQASISVKNNDGVAIDWDATFVVHRDWPDTDQDGFRRFAPNGQRIDLWPGRRTKDDADRPEWPRMPSYPARLASSSDKFHFGWDGAFYILEHKGQFVAKYARDGQLIGVVPLGLPVYSLYGFCVARDGTMSILFRHSQKIGDHEWPHLARVLPDGRAFVAIGPHVGDQPFIGKYTDRIKGGPDGSVWLGDDFSELRLLAPNGTVAWRSIKTINEDKSELADLAKARKPKVLAADRGG